MTDPRIKRLRDADSNGNAYLVPEMRNAWPAVVALVEQVLEQHKALGNLTGHCRYCQPHEIPWPCPEAKAALAVLDTLGEA